MRGIVILKIQCLFIPGEFGSLEFGTGFFGFEVGEIYIFFSFSYFRHIFSILALNFGIYIFSIYFTVWKLLFLLDIFISAQNYRIAPSTAD